MTAVRSEAFYKACLWQTNIPVCNLNSSNTFIRPALGKQLPAEHVSLASNVTQSMIRISLVGIALPGRKGGKPSDENIGTPVTRLTRKNCKTMGKPGKKHGNTCSNTNNQTTVKQCICEDQDSGRLILPLPLFCRLASST